MGACYKFQTTPMNCCAAAVSSSSVLVNLKELLTKPAGERGFQAGGSVSDLHLLMFRKPRHTFSEAGSWLTPFAMRSLLMQCVSMIWKDTVLKTPGPAEGLLFIVLGAGVSLCWLLSVLKQTAKPPLHSMMGKALTLRSYPFLLSAGLDFVPSRLWIQFKGWHVSVSIQVSKHTCGRVSFMTGHFIPAYVLRSVMELHRVYMYCISVVESFSTSLTRNLMLSIQCQKWYTTCKKKILKQRLNKVPETSHQGERETCYKRNRSLISELLRTFVFDLDTLSPFHQHSRRQLVVKHLLSCLFTFRINRGFFSVCWFMKVLKRRNKMLGMLVSVRAAWEEKTR